MNAIATLADNIGNDLALGLDKSLVVQYWTARANANNSRPRAVAAKPAKPTKADTIRNIRQADDETLIEMLADYGKHYSWSSLGRCMAPESESKTDTKLRHWCMGITTPQRSSYEEIRTFLIELAKGEHDDNLKSPGGNRRG